MYCHCHTVDTIHNRLRLLIPTQAVGKSLDRCEAGIAATDDIIWLKYIRLKRVVLAGLYAREKSPEAHRLLDIALDKEPSLAKKLLLIAAFRYTAAGGRGIHRLLRKVL